MAPAATPQLAIHGGPPVRSAEKPWPAWPIFSEAERQALNTVLESGQWWYGGRVAEFEHAFAAFQGAKHCVTCSSGTTALEICLQVLGIKAGDEIIVPAYTFIATAGAVARMGGTPVFVDVDASWCLDGEKLEEAVTPRSKAVIPVHFGGRIADMDRINAIADKHELKVIEDACHAWGSQWRGRGAGVLGFCGVFSFQVTKNITAGEGGAIVTDDEAFAEACRSVTNTGRIKEGPGFHALLIGTNARITEFQAALLRAQLSRLEPQTLLRQKNAARLDRELGNIEGIIPQPGAEPITRRAYHLYCFRFNEEQFGCSRGQFVRAANAEGLPLRTGYDRPLYRQPVFDHIVPDHDGRYHCPVAEDLCCRSAVWLGHSLLLGSEEDITDIIAVVRKLKEHVRELRG